MLERMNASPRKSVPDVSGFSVSKSALRSALNPAPRSLAASAWAMPRPIATATAIAPMTSIGSQSQFATV